jgi:hypothetical protein
MQWETRKFPWIEVALAEALGTKMKMAVHDFSAIDVKMELKKGILL